MNASPVPPVIPDYELVRELGRGSFGSVWLGRSRTGVHHAIKIVPKSRERLLEKELEGIRAYELLARKHPNLVEVRHVGETAECLYCVLELADGYGTAPTYSAADYEPHTLQSDLDRRGALPLTEAADVARAVLDGLAHMHASGLLHRDVKPANILFVDGRAKLGDVGLVAVTSRREDRAGSPAFMPPESVQDSSGDLYSLGITLFCAVTGGQAVRFPELPQAIAPERLASFQKLAPVIDRACAPHRDDRFHDAREFRHALDAVLGVVPGRVRARRRLFVAGATAILIASVCTFAWREIRASQRAPIAITGRLEIRYQDPHDSTVTRVVDERSPYVPLRTEGKVSIHAELSEPGYPVLAYFDESGASQLLYPFTGTEQKPVTSAASGRFPLEDPAVTMTFVLLASRDPVEDPEALVRDLAQVEDPPRCPPNVLLHVGEDGISRTVAARRDLDRSAAPELGRMIDSAPLPHPVSGSLDRLRAQYGARFDVVRALSVPQVSLEKN